MNNSITPAYEDTTEVEALLVGRRIVKIKRVKNGSENGDLAILTLDNGTKIELGGHDGGCACSSGCYELGHLTDLSEVDNIITSVLFDSSGVTSGSYEELGGEYRIFVFAGNRAIQLAGFDGDDGNGYYGTGYYLTVKDPRS